MSKEKDEDVVHQTMSEDADKAHAVIEQITPKNVLGQEAQADGQGQTVVKSPNEIYNNISGGQDKVNIDVLMAEAGVTKEDFQAVCDEHPEIIQNIGGGPTCQKLAGSADKVRNSYGADGKLKTGSCLSGVNNIYNNCKVDSLTNKDAYKYKVETLQPYQRGVPGGCCGYEVLEKSGDFISLSVKNSAYGYNSSIRSNEEMNDLFKKVQPGVTVTVDDIRDSSVRGKLGNTAGGKYGHIAVKRNNSQFACDFVQNKISFSRYGEYAHACFPKDAQISQEYAEMVIAKAQERQAKENQQTNNNQQARDTSQPRDVQQTVNNNQQSAAMQYAMLSRGGNSL